MAAGSRQQSRFIAMMQNYARNTELVNTAQHAAGASTEQFNKTLESLDAKLNQLKTQWQSYTTTIFNSDLIKRTVDSFTFLLKTINDVTGHSGILKIGAGVLIFKQLHNAVNALNKPLTNLMINFKSMGTLSAFKTFNQELISGVKYTNLLKSQNRDLLTIQELIAHKQAISAEIIRATDQTTTLLVNKGTELLGLQRLQYAYNLSSTEAETAAVVCLDEELSLEQRSVFLTQYKLELEKLHNAISAGTVKLTEEQVINQAKEVALNKTKNSLYAKNLSTRIGE